MTRQRIAPLNLCGSANATWILEYFRSKYHAETKTPPKRGIDSVNVPGAVTGWVALIERLGNPQELLNIDLKPEMGKRVPVKTKAKLRDATNVHANGLPRPTLSQKLPDLAPVVGENASMYTGEDENSGLFSFSLMYE